MGWWSIYFFAKLLLYAGGYIDFSVWWNGALAVLLALPVRNERQALTKNLIGSAAAIVLLYHDSWLPPLGRLFSQADYLAQFSVPYLIELLGRFFSLRVIISLLVLLALYVLLKRKLRMSTLVFVGIFVVMLAPLFKAPVQGMDASSMLPVNTASATSEINLRTLSGEALNRGASEFYAKEAKREVRFGSADGTPFDVVILHVCSLSWDDLQQTGRTDNVLFKQFAVTFTNFNSAASYSGPAAIRLLRGRCGDVPHKTLYEPANPDCLLMDGLQQAGFKPYWAMNHDGHFGNFFADVKQRGGMPAELMSVAGAGVAQRAFDGSPIYDDYAVLSRWWQLRGRDQSARAVLYYNTISLHDGNRFEGQSHSASYQQRVDRLMQDVNRFVSDLRKSDRPVLLVFIPEHGAALKGDKRQIDGLREIPTPAITHVPVGMMLINAGTPVPVTVEVPSSYLAMSTLLSRFIEHSPFSAASLDLNSYVRDLPVTTSFAENEGTLVWQQGSSTMMRTPDGQWTAL